MPCDNLPQNNTPAEYVTFLRVIWPWNQNTNTDTLFNPFISKLHNNDTTMFHCLYKSTQFIAMQSMRLQDPTIIDF